MRATIILTATLLALTGGAPAFAQPTDTDVPAEIPSSDYTGRQYVDSRGCVYVRAGIDGAVNWVPRVTRSRQHLCGAQPTEGAGTGDAEAAAARLAGAERIVPEAVPRDVARPVASARAILPEPSAPVRAPRPAETVAGAAAGATMRAPASKPAAASPPVVRPVPAVAHRAEAPVLRPMHIDASSTICVENSPELACLERRGDRPERLRMASSAVPQGTARGVAPEARAAVLPPGTRILPRHVYEERSPDRPQVPYGYRRAWDDDRLNPNRANMSIEGYRRTQLTWTKTVPRRGVGRTEPVLIEDPTLLYPDELIPR